MTKKATFARMVSSSWKIVSTSFFEQTNFEQLIISLYILSSFTKWNKIITWQSWSRFSRLFRRCLSAAPTWFWRRYDSDFCSSGTDLDETVPDLSSLDRSMRNWTGDLRWTTSFPLKFFVLISSSDSRHCWFRSKKHFCV